MTEYPTREQLRINGTTDYYNDGVTFNKAADTSADGYILYRFFSGTSKVITKDPSYVPPPALTPVQIQKVIDDIDRGQSLGVHSRTGDTTTLSNNAGDWFLDSDDNNRMYQATDSGQNLMAFTAVSLPGISSGVIQDAQASYTALVAGGLVTEGNLGFVTVEEIGTGTPANPQYPKGIYKNTGGVLAIYSEDAGNQAPAFHEPATRGDTVQNVAPTALEVPNVVEGDTARVELSDGAREWWLYTGGAWVKRSYVPASGAALTQAQAESTTGADYSAEGTVSAEVLDFWGISRRVQRIFDVTTTFDYPALNYADRTAVYVRNANSASGIGYIYRTDNTVSLELRRADGTTEIDTPGDNDFNVQPGEIVFGEKDGNVFRASIIPGERVKNFTNAATANAFGPMPHDSIVTLRDESKIAWRRTGINNSSFPADGLTNTDWWVFDLGAGVINPDDITEWSATETNIPQGALRKVTGTPVVIYGRIVSDATADGGASPDVAKWQEVNQAADNVLTVIDSDTAGGNSFAVYGKPSLYEVTGATPLTIFYPTDGGVNANLRSVVYNKGTSTVTIEGEIVPAGGIAFIQADPDVAGPFVWVSGSNDGGTLVEHQELIGSTTNAATLTLPTGETWQSLLNTYGKLRFVAECSFGSVAGVRYPFDVTVEASELTEDTNDKRISFFSDGTSSVIWALGALTNNTAFWAGGGSASAVSLKVYGIRTTDQFVDKDAVIPVEDREVRLIDVEGVNNTFYAFSTGETWADIKANYEQLRFDISTSDSGQSLVVPHTVFFHTDDFDAFEASAGNLLVSSAGVNVGIVTPSDTDTGFTYQQASGDSPGSDRMRFHVTGIKKRTTVVRPEDVRVAAFVHNHATTAEETVAIPAGFTNPIVNAQSNVGDTRIQVTSATEFTLQIFNSAGTAQADPTVYVQIMEATQ